MRVPIGQTAAVGRTYLDLSVELTQAIVQTIDAGWPIAAARAEVTTDADEVTITECLRDGMRTALTLRRLPWRRTMIVAPGTESRSRSGMVSPDGRTDIPIYLTRIFARSGEHDPHAIIECKRLAEGHPSLAREYVVEGIDRFRNGKYGENHGRGFMVGYVVAGTRDGAVDGINRYLDGRARSAEALAQNVVPPATWVSEHPRETGRSIRLHHAMLSVA